MTVNTRNSAWASPRFLLHGAALLFIFCTAAIAGDKPEVPEINGNAGSCSVSFTVTNSEHKPIYNAKIEVVIRYGAMGLHKSELQVGTNSDGKARVTGLPEKMKKPLEFSISSGEFSKKVTLEPKSKCHETFDVVLGTK
jgi:hypothetical protein